MFLIYYLDTSVRFILISRNSYVRKNNQKNSIQLFIDLQILLSNSILLSIHCGDNGMM